MSESEEIRRMFEKDSMDKKRVGSNVHKMRGKGKKGGLKYGVLLGRSVFDKPYSKNTKTETFNFGQNIFDIDTFLTYSEEKQKEFIEGWLDKYSENKILKGLGISRTKFDRIKRDLNINKMSINQEAGRVKELLPDNISMEKFNPNDFDKRAFNLLPDADKYVIAEKLRNDDNLSNKDIGNLIGVSTRSFTVYRSGWKKAWVEKQKFIDDNKPEHTPVKSFDTDGLSEEIVKKYEAIYKENNSEEIPILNYSFQGVFDGNELAKELELISKMIKDHDDVSVSIRIRK